MPAVKAYSSKNSTGTSECSWIEKVRLAAVSLSRSVLPPILSIYSRVDCLKPWSRWSEWTRTRVICSNSCVVRAHWSCSFAFARLSGLDSASRERFAKIRDYNSRRVTILPAVTTTQSCVCEISPSLNVLREHVLARETQTQIQHATDLFSTVSISARQAKPRSFKKKYHAAITFAPVTSTANYRIIGDKRAYGADSRARARARLSNVDTRWFVQNGEIPANVDFYILHKNKKTDNVIVRSAIMPVRSSLLHLLLSGWAR